MERSQNPYERYEKLIKKAKKGVKKSDKMVFFKYGGDFGMSADIANRLKYLFPDKFIVIIKVKEGRASLSIRGKNIREKVVKVVKDIEGATGGGHEHAVGAQMNAEDVEKFEKELRKLV